MSIATAKYSIFLLQVILGVFLFGQLEFEEKGEASTAKTKRVLKARAF